LIPITHTLKLKEACKCPYEVIFPENMDHSLINPKEDLCDPIENFLVKHTDYMNDEFVKYDYKIPEDLRNIPKYLMSEYNLIKGNWKVGDVKNYGCFN